MQIELPSLFALAHDHSAGARVLLASKLADLFLAGNANLNEREEIMVNELIDTLVKTEDLVVRHEIVKRFANIRHLPRRTAVCLASGAIDIARSVLSNAATLTDDDLISVVETQSADHACAVAARAEVNEAVADALVTTGSLRVMQIVAENLGTRLSQRALGILSETARVVASLQKPIMKRPELTPDVASRLYWWVTQDVRRHAIERFGFSAGLLDLALAKAIETKLNEHIFERHEDAAMTRVADWLDERGAITLAVLPKLLRLGHFRLFNISLGRLARLELPLVDMIVAETGGRLLAVLCRAIGVDKPSFVSIFLLSRGARADEHVVHPRELSQALGAYDRILPDLAREMLGLWRSDAQKLKQFAKGV